MGTGKKNNAMDNDSTTAQVKKVFIHDTTLRPLFHSFAKFYMQYSKEIGKGTGTTPII
jgi:hypothetical protein